MIPSTQEHGSRFTCRTKQRRQNAHKGRTGAGNGITTLPPPRLSKALRMNELDRVQSLLFTNITFSLYPTI